MNSHSAENHATREKRKAALSSVFAAVGLALFKLIVGLATNSLGILSEAAHSGLDLVAAFITYLAVRVSDKPADQKHPYGHGKVENFSALVETVLLLLTCLWIIWEAVERLFYKSVAIDASLWAFLVMLVSIGIDISRSRMLYRTAKKYNSQALEADALHFQTDIWSSCVVLLGLFGVLIADLFPRWRILEKADAVAALGVALIVVGVSYRLGKRTIDALVDAAPDGLSKRIQESVEGIAGVSNCHHVRVRMSGPAIFVDVHVLLDGNQTLSQAHRLTETIEETIRQISPQADVTVHPEPVAEHP